MSKRGKKLPQGWEQVTHEGEPVQGRYRGPRSWFTKPLTKKVKGRVKRDATTGRYYTELKEVRLWPGWMELWGGGEMKKIVSPKEGIRGAARSAQMLAEKRSFGRWD